MAINVVEYIIISSFIINDFSSTSNFILDDMMMILDMIDRDRPCTYNISFSLPTYYHSRPWTTGGKSGPGLRPTVPTTG